MPLSINWLTKVIFIPKSYLVNEGDHLYAMNVNQFRLDLKDIEDGDGIPFEDTHRHVGEVTLSGVTYSRFVEIINGYKIEFEDDGTEYQVRLFGANHNIADVKVRNCVSIVVQNSAGLQTVNIAGGAAPSASDVANAVWSHASALTLQDRVLICAKILRNKTITDPVTGVMTVYDDDGTTVLFTAQMYEGAVVGQTYRGQGAERRERLA